MAEELQNLLERIQKEGVDRADEQAAKIIDEAKTKAKTIVAEAETQSAALIEKAKEDSELFTKRSESAIAQAARDLILSVGEAITETLQSIISRNMDGVMDSDALPGLIKDTIAAYQKAGGESNLEVILNKEQKEAVEKFFMKELADSMKAGLTIRSNRNIVSGFRVSMKDSGVQHDFTGEALSTAIGELLRPQLAEIIRKSLAKTEGVAAQ